MYPSHISVHGVKAMPTLSERFWVKVNIKGEHDCWPWFASVRSDGYGAIGHKDRVLSAHRVAWSLTYGLIPEGMCVCHHCDNKTCCNPKHLFLGTAADNAADRAGKGRNADKRGERNGRSKLTAKQVLEIRRCYSAGGVTQRELADEFGIAAQSQISNIVHRHRWKHLPEEENAREKV